MCGIIGLVSKDACSDLRALDSLKTLEYRGYDSFGFLNDVNVEPSKYIGSISKTDYEKDTDNKSRITIAHTRWATHGIVNIENTHPHTSMNGDFAIVHNGVISNYLQLKELLVSRGYSFYGSTDSEILVNMIDYIHKRSDKSEYDFIPILKELSRLVEGEFAICVYSKKHFGESIYAMKRKSPLVLSHNETFGMFASDPIAVSSMFESYIDIADGEFVKLSRENKDINVFVYDSNLKKVNVDSRYLKVEIQKEETELKSFPNYMWKEMYEIPQAIRSVCTLDIGTIKKSIAEKSIMLIGCGSAYYVSEMGLYLRQMGTPYSKTYCIQADEIENKVSLKSIDTLICISQSGETFDTLEPAKKVLQQGNSVIGITNVGHSTLAKISTHSIVQNAGVERCVLSTKSIVSQFSILYRLFAPNDNLKELPTLWESTFTTKLLDRLEAYAYLYKDLDHFFHVGRGIYYPIALENALKLKEVTYCHAEGMGAGFFKHGTLSLIDDRFLTFAHLPSRETDQELYDLTQANISEIRSRNGRVITVGHDSSCDIQLLHIDRYLNPILHLGVGQYFAYYLAMVLGRNVDQPRSLAKSVTVR